MGLAECIASAAHGVGRHDSGAKWSEDAFPDEVQVESSPENFSDCRTAFLDVLRFVIESSKQHFNPYYRLQGLSYLFWSDNNICAFSWNSTFTFLKMILLVPFIFLTFPVCEKVLEAATSLVSTLDVPLEILLHFIATLPRAFTDYGGNYAMWIHGFSFTSVIYLFLLAWVVLLICFMVVLLHHQIIFSSSCSMYMLAFSSMTYYQ